MKLAKNLINPIIFIAIAATLRLLPHIPNVAPITAMALFGGAYLNKKYALIVPLIAMVASDIFLGFNPSTPMVYISFFIIGLIGIWLKTHKNFTNILSASIVSSIIFYLLTNFNYWYATPLYPKNFNGLLESYWFALPFFRNTVLGDLFYTGVMFGSYELVLRFLGQSFSSKAKAS